MRLINRLMFMFVVNVLASSHFTIHKLRGSLLKLAGLNIETNAIKSKCYFNTNDINIGKDSFVNQYCKFFSSEVPGGEITIGKKCFIAMNVTFTTITHEVSDSSKRAGKNKYCPIVVENGCWIGVNSTILPGVTIGQGCIIAAGSVVTKDCKPNGLYAGVPAIRIKDLD